MLTSKSDLERALDHLRQRGQGSEDFSTEFAKFEKLRQAEQLSQTREEKEEYTRQIVAMLKAGRNAGRFSHADYVSKAAYFVIRIHEDRWLNDGYPELVQLSAEMQKIQDAHGLKHDEYWPRGEGPEDYEELNHRYREALNSHVAPTLREFDIPDIADLFENDRRRYEELVEQGRRATFDPPDHIERLERLFARYRREAELAYSVGAFYATAALCAAAIESLLLLQTFRDLETARDALARLPRGRRPRHSDPIRWGLADLVSVAHAAGWLPDFDTPDAIIIVSALSDSVREYRNLIHPARHLRHDSSRSIEEMEAEDARALLTIVEHLLASARGRDS